jgi:hypothetical protein
MSTIYGEGYVADTMPSGETMQQREEVCAAWHALPDDLRKDERLTRLYHALGGPRMEEPSEAASGVAPTDLARQWSDAYAAFKGAFDTPQMRRNMPDEYSADARQRLREFDDAFRTSGVAPSPEPLPIINCGKCEDREECKNGCVRHAAAMDADGVDSVDEALPYKTPMELWQAFKGGAKFVLRYHGKTFDVTHMEPREKVVYVQPPGMPVKVFPDGRSAEGPSPAIRLAALGVDTSDGGQHE